MGSDIEIGSYLFYRLLNFAQRLADGSKIGKIYVFDFRAQSSIRFLAEEIVAFSQECDVAHLIQAIQQRCQVGIEVDRILGGFQPFHETLNRTLTAEGCT